MVKWVVHPYGQIKHSIIHMHGDLFSLLFFISVDLRHRSSQNKPTLTSFESGGEMKKTVNIMGKYWYRKICWIAWCLI